MTLKLSKEQLLKPWESNPRRTGEGLEEKTEIVREFYSYLKNNTSGFAREWIERKYSFKGDELTAEYVLNATSSLNPPIRSQIQQAVIDYQKNKN